MFRCGYNKELSNPGEKGVRLVIAKRPKTYYNVVHTSDDEVNEGEEILAQGWEIEKEIVVRECNVEKAKKKYGLYE